MSYMPTEWKSGDTVTSAKLNKIEQGIAAGSGILIAHAIIENGGNPPALDKTWQEIHDADACYIVWHDEESSYCQLVIETYIDDGLYKVDVFDFTGDPYIYATDSPSNYPVLYINPNAGNSPAVV